jgi:hypothetical protein
MYRLPYRSMASRETNRLPVGEVQKRLGSAIPNIEGLRGSDLSSVPGYFVYLGTNEEFGFEGPGQRFRLVEINSDDEFIEKVLDQGEVTAICKRSFAPIGRTSESDYVWFMGNSGKLGRYRYCCSPNKTEWPVEVRGINA